MADVDAIFDFQAHQKIALMQQKLDALNISDGGGTSGGMEARVAKLEADVEHIKIDIGDLKADLRSLRTEARTDFRVLFGATITVALGLAALMGKGFHWF